jgi:hypothetical protein
MCQIYSSSQSNSIEVTGNNNLTTKIVKLKIEVLRMLHNCAVSKLKTKQHYMIMLWVKEDAH